MRIYKYPIQFSDAEPVRVDLPKGAEILTVNVQGKQPVLWALIDPECKETETRLLKIAATGEDIIAPKKYLGTFFTGPFVWHVLDYGEV